MNYSTNSTFMLDDFKKKKPKVSIEICGGFGNQLFLIAAVLHYAKKFNYEPVFPDTKNLPKYTCEERHSYWEILNSSNKINFKNVNKNQFKIYKENEFNFNEFIDQRADTYLSGYYQSYKYVDYVKDDMIAMIYSSSNYNNKADQLYKNLTDKFKTDNLISIHIRRGDYLKHSDIHTNLSIEYYITAINKISSTCPVIVFSNDIEWCKNNLSKNITNPIYFIENIIDEFNDYIELLLMSKIKYNIIANSSFSWWAAYLNNNKDKKIIAPAMWFEYNGPKNWQDLYYDNWSII